MKDLVCGMDVTLPIKFSFQWNGKEYVFCSAGCKSKFQSNPKKYTRKDASARSMPVERQDFTPLILILVGILILTSVKYVFSGGAGIRDAMYDFMGMFFVVFGGFKMLDVKGFADAYATYDIVAKKSRAYALFYPFIEMALGLAYLIRWNEEPLNWVTLVIMTVGSIGVAKALAKNQRIQCACLGTKIKLPMTKVTLLEDILMAAMALVMIFF
jgi:YHS domain-containing protein